MDEREKIKPEEIIARDKVTQMITYNGAERIG
jgi:hypothetical protein